MKKFLLTLLLLGATMARAQVPAPPVYASGPFGPGGSFPALNAGNLIFASDANHTMVYPETSAHFLKLTSAASLTATRNLVAPLTIGFDFVIENATTGGQSIQIIGSSGSGVTIANGSTVHVVSDGANYVSAGGSSGGSITSVFGRTGVVVAQTGDYSVSQVSGAAPLASPTFTGTPAAPTPATTDNSTDIATTAYTRSYVAGLAYVGASGSFTVGHCAQIANTSPLQISDAGAGCGSGSGFSLTVNGGTALASPVNLQNTSGGGAGAINISNPSGSNVQAVLANSGVTAGTYGDATHTVTVAVNAAGQATTVSANAIPTAAAGTNGLSSPDNATIKAAAGVETVQPVTVSGVAFTPGTPGYLPADHINAAPARDTGGRLAALANNLISDNQFAFAPGSTPDGTHCWYAGANYHSEGCYGEDTIQTMLAFPGAFTATDILSVATKFIAAKKVSGDGNPATLSPGDFPQTLLPSGAAGQFCSGLDAYCHLATGGGKIYVPIGLFLYWQKTGDLTYYTANVAAIKTALALVPVNGTTGCVNITAGQEDIPGNGYMEYMRPTGNVANASVWYAWDYLALYLQATAAGDSTNATLFHTAFTSLQTCLQTTLTDSSSHLLWFADGQSKQLDIADSTLAIYPLLGAANGTLLTGTQATQISTWLNSNYSSLVNSAGYVKLINACNTGQVGNIPSSGGPPYTGTGTYGTTGYQCGYWATYGGYFAYAVGITNPAQASTYIATYLGGTLLTTEYYNQGSALPQGDSALMTTAQTMRMVNSQFPALPAAPTTGLCVLDTWGNCTNNVPNSTLGAGVGVAIPFAIEQTNTYAFTSGYNAVNSFLNPNAATGAHLINVFGLANNTNNDAYFGFVNAGGLGNCANYGTLGYYQASPDMNDLVTWGYCDGRTQIKYDLHVDNGTVSAQTIKSANIVGTGTSPYTFGVSGGYTGPLVVPAYCPNGTSFNLFSFNNTTPNNVTLSSCGQLRLVSPTGEGGYIGDVVNTNDIIWDGAGHVWISNLGSGTSANSDLNGEVTLSSGTASHTFANFSGPDHPICVATDATATNPVRVSYSGGSGSAWALTITGTSTDVVDYICTGRN